MSDDSQENEAQPVEGSNAINNPAGSMWARWDPHVHGPGTIFNDQFKNDWDGFLKTIEESDPPIKALGITDYYTLDVYEAILKQKNENGRLPGVELIFPNVEMRYDVGTSKGSPINFHLLISPEDPDHIAEARRFLGKLKFHAHDEDFMCTRDDLIKLGKAHDKTIKDDDKALSAGANQFKVNRDDLRRAIKDNKWAQSNILIAVAAADGDGTAGLQGDAALATLRQELEKSAHIIFSSTPSVRKFWLGQGAAPLNEIIQLYNGPKPCLHGSDAHEVATTGAPPLNRYCWIKGDLTFESIRQVCLEPETRIHVGPTSPETALPSQLMTSVAVTEADWFPSEQIPLNPGLVAIIGARGSGKTALADIIATGAYAISDRLSPTSFVVRAKEYLGESTPHLTWASGEKTNLPLNAAAAADLIDYPRVQYLSQQFVDRLCSSDGLNTELLDEISRVIYQAHPSDSLMGTSSFEELLNLKTAPSREQREFHIQTLAEVSKDITIERARNRELPKLTKQRDLQNAALERDKKDRVGLMPKGESTNVTDFEKVNTALEAVRSKLEQARRRQQSIERLKAEVKNLNDSSFPTKLRQLQETYRDAGLDDSKWKLFRFAFAGDVEKILKDELALASAAVSKLAGPAPGEIVVAEDDTTPVSPITYIPEEADLQEQTASLLEKEHRRLSQLIGIDALKAKQLVALNEKIARQEAALIKLNEEITLASGAADRIKTLLELKKTSYAAIFDALVHEETQLAALYQPLRESLQGEVGALSKLTFQVERDVDLKAWAAEGETLLDLRVAGPFRGQGELFNVAKSMLETAWLRGSSVEVSTAMTAFREAHEADILQHAPVSKMDVEAYRQWAARVSSWLYSTSHITIRYSLQYDGVNIEQLSPGTRGIVLLLLYLAIDKDDDRPLIIDQPEENLDPKSIYDELVPRFRKAKARRQIIIVTHNANLVVNTDADQVIIASCGPHRHEQLPVFSYQTGGLENPEIRRKVCEILEGGQAAFKERAKRLRVTI